MKTSLLLSLFALTLVSTAPLQAAFAAENFEQAQSRLTDTGYIVFFYPADWDKFGKKLCNKLYNSDKVRQAAGDAVLLKAPVYQTGSDAQKTAAKDIMGKLGYPGDMSRISYPAIVFYEKCGRSYASLGAESLVDAGVDKVAATVKNRLEAKKRQDALLARANAAAGAERARLLLQSAQVPGLEWPGGLRDAMAKADPQDASGCRAALDFSCNPGKDESMDAYLKRVDAALENTLLTPGQKQRACAMAIGHVRRSMGMMAGGDIIRKYATAMQKLDPESTLGLAAPVVLRDWVKEYRYGQGWSPEVLPGSPTPMKMHGAPIKAPGEYTVSFYIVTGRDAVSIRSVRLLDGDKAVAADEREQQVDYNTRTRTYSLSVKKEVKNPVLEIVYLNDAGHRSTWGNVTVEKK